MERKLSILLIEDDQKACDDIIRYIDELEDVTLIGVTNNSTKAIEYFQNYLPDAIILDLELHLGSGNGLEFLNELNKLNLNINPYILVTTNNSSTITYEYARQLGADFIMSKHQANYSAGAVVEFLRTMKNIIQKNSERKPSESTTKESPEQKEKRLARIISLELDRVGISPKAVGYKYLLDAIQLIIKDSQNNFRSIIGDKYNKTNASVERAMQNAIDRAWRTADIDDLSLYYTARISSDKGVPTLTEFIFYYANKIRNNN